MGVVYLAEQREPIRRTVAVKMMKVGMDTKEVIGRFETERQALAVMEHPSIAKVLDAGATDTGRPYFVMEHVKGVPFNQYCDTRRLSTKERLQLFIPVCEAIQHAHQKGIIHRDLKPSNILVTEKDGQPVPKIIDFGIAKAIGQRLSERTVVTMVGQMIGTPAYMSPEQAEMSGLDVDTRTDIYSLGVMLYEILVGNIPIDPYEVGLTQFIAQLVMRETDPPTLSSRLDSLGGQRKTIAAARSVDPEHLKKELSGDLQWIVLKAMDKDRTRRYETTNGLAMDLQRHLNDEPVVARPPTAGYRFQKFYTRNKAGVVAAGAAAAALVVGIVLATTGLLRAQRAERVAQQEAEASAQVSDFLVGLFEVSDPGEALGNTVTAREILDRGAERIREDLADQPAIQARMQATIGRVYGQLGLYDVARSLHQRALDTRKSVFGEEHADVAESMFELGMIAYRQSQYVEAESLFVASRQIREHTLGADHLAVAESMNWAANTQLRLGRRDEAASTWRKVLEIREAQLVPNTSK